MLLSFGDVLKYDHPPMMPIYVMMSVSTLRPQFGQLGRLLWRFDGRGIHRHAAAAVF
jgi:hypothetical protein